jgi:hypothetical protein
MTDEKILGYDAKGKPIHETKRGFVYTAACISCSKCKAIIRGSGGPMFNSLCVPCHEAQKNTGNVSTQKIPRTKNNVELHYPH